MICFSIVRDLLETKFVSKNLQIHSRFSDIVNPIELKHSLQVLFRVLSVFRIFLWKLDKRTTLENRREIGYPLWPIYIPAESILEFWFDGHMGFIHWDPSFLVSCSTKWAKRGVVLNPPLNKLIDFHLWLSSELSGFPSILSGMKFTNRLESYLSINISSSDIDVVLNHNSLFVY